jgi:hypothetical protein
LSDGLVRRSQRQLGKEVVALGLFAVDVLERVESLDLAGETDLLVGGIELGDRSGAGAAGQQRLPGGFDIVSDRGHQAETGDDDTTRQSYFPIFSCR